MSIFDKIQEFAGTAFNTSKATAQDVADRTRNAAQDVAERTKNAAQTGKIKFAITSEESKLEKIYTELGRLFYQDYKSGNAANLDDYMPWCNKADEVNLKIEAYNAELSTLKEPAAAVSESDVQNTGEPELTIDISESADMPADEAAAGSETETEVEQETVSPEQTHIEFVISDTDAPEEQ